MEAVIAAVAGAVACVVVYFVLEALVESPLVLLRHALARRAARESAVRTEFECSLRTLSGRAYNLGTDWTSGIATVSPGNIHFLTSMRSTGERRIQVLAASRTGSPALDGLVVARLETPEGVLEWRVERRSAGRALGLVLGG